MIAGARRCSCGSRFMRTVPVKMVYDAKLKRYDNEFCVQCEDCGERGPRSKRERLAIEAWETGEGRVPRSQWEATAGSEAETERLERAKALGMV